MSERNEAGKQLLLLLLGILMCGAGLYLFSKNVMVSAPRFGNMYSSWGIFGSRGIPGGMVVIPLIIGIVVWVIFPKSFAGKLISMLGTLFIILGVVSSVELDYRRTSLYEFILMLILIFGGGALALGVLFMLFPDNSTPKKSKIDKINEKFND